uniref:Uncharacterized protein n=1 Tax=Vespula pensylvanica TaxID=30213 RepID=A0A834P1X4_VESPE|nr:hypothetical protein H0235_007763 [Vespula pensylvanica]
MEGGPSPTLATQVYHSTPISSFLATPSFSLSRVEKQRERQAQSSKGAVEVRAKRSGISARDRYKLLTGSRPTPVREPRLFTASFALPPGPNPLSELVHDNSDDDDDDDEDCCCVSCFCHLEKSSRRVKERRFKL